MDFSSALSACRNGKKISRKGWNGQEQYVMEVLNPCGETLDGREIIRSERPCLVFFGTQGIQFGWLASQADMLSGDWRIVED